VQLSGTRSRMPSVRPKQAEQSIFESFASACGGLLEREWNYDVNIQSDQIG